jgi:Sec-independent protein translocase protein TatA
VDTIGPWVLLIIVLAIGLLFAADRLPQMARSLGERHPRVPQRLHEGSQPGNLHATQEPGTNSPPGR